MGAPLSPHWPGGEVQGERRRTREGGGVLASSLICKKCITSEIKRKITEQHQNIQRKEREREMLGARVGRKARFPLNG